MKASIRRVAVIYDDGPRSDTTGGYCLRALRDLVSVVHFRPNQLGEVRAADFDLFLRVDDGLDAEVPKELKPLAWWAIDTHVTWDRCLALAAAADFNFAAQRPGVEAFRRAGLTAEWLPLACDPGVHRHFPVAKRYDFAFVGRVGDGSRAALLKRLQARYPAHFVGRAYFEDMAREYSAARTAFNRSIADDLNMRVFEALACGSLLVTNALTAAAGQDDFFRDGVHLATYATDEELFEKVDYYLSHPDARSLIEGRGRAEVLGSHTYLQRMAAVLDHVARQPTTARRSVEVVPKPPAGYFDHARPELLALVPTDARSILEVGCGRGRLGAAIKARQPARVIGWEVDPGAASVARRHLDEVVEGDVEADAGSFPAGAFDTIVCGDVLEHLREPGATLRRLRGYLTSDGKLIASLPNARHHSVIRGLLGGDWTYEPAGLLDRTHLRFFTKREIEKLFHRAGFRSEPLVAVPGPGYAAWAAAGRPPHVDAGSLRVGPLDKEQAEEFFAYQWLVVSRPDDRPDRGLTSIVVLTFNQLDVTRQCLDSVRHLTDEPYELVMVDNGSSDGTREYLRALASEDPRVRIVLNAENLGFPAAANQGLRLARGRQAVLLNNDTVVTTGWLRHLLDSLYATPATGLTGPCSNRVSGPQQIDVGYAPDLVGLDGFAWDRGRAFRGRTELSDRLVGFCLAIRREVWEGIGELDERFGIGNFEDDDYCRRARAAGYELRIALACFVHHFGSVSFVGAGVDLAAILESNRRVFEQKWAAPPPIDNPEGTPSGQSDQIGGEVVNDGKQLALERPLLSVCLIVRDNATTLRPCLDSIRPWVDEIVVVDTGSADDTPRIAEAAGARVFHYPWCDDFSAARNESFRHARGRWLFWMDSDDTIPAENGLRLRVLVEDESSPEILGYVVQVHCPGPGPNGHLDTTVVDHVKLVRNLPSLRFEGRIHEQILPAIRRAGGQVAWTDLFVVHTGYDHSPDGQVRKRDRDLRLLGLELAERPGHPFTLFNLGMTCADIRRFADAEGYLRASLRASDPGESHVRKAYALLICCLAQMGRHAEADAECDRALALFPEDLELTFRKALIAQQEKRPGEAVALYRKVLSISGPRHFTSVDRGIGGHKARHNLAVLHGELGELGLALEQWQTITAEVPDYRPGWRGYGEALLQAQRLADAAALADHLEVRGSLPQRAEGWLLRGRIQSQRGDLPAAMASWGRACEIDPHEPEPYREMARAAFSAGEWETARSCLQEAVRCDPDDPRSWHNLGATLLSQGRFAEAVGALREATRLRPHHSETANLLGIALSESTSA